MPAFLSDQWIEALSTAASTAAVDSAASLAIRQVVDDTAWTMRVAAGTITVDRQPDADVTLTTDRATAAAMVRGELAAQDAVAAGRLRFAGDVAKLLAAADALAGLDAVFAGVRAETTY